MNLNEVTLFYLGPTWGIQTNAFIGATSDCHALGLLKLIHNCLHACNKYNIRLTTLPLLLVLLSVFVTFR